MTYRIKAKLWFAASAVSALLASYCYAGAVMNGSFAVAAAADAAELQRSASLFFWLSATFASLAIVGLAWGLVRYGRRRGRSET
jgi:hypothetical protein